MKAVCQKLFFFSICLFQLKLLLIIATAYVMPFYNTISGVLCSNMLYTSPQRQTDAQNTQRIHITGRWIQRMRIRWKFIANFKEQEPMQSDLQTKTNTHINHPFAKLFLVVSTQFYLFTVWGLVKGLLWYIYHSLWNTTEQATLLPDISFDCSVKRAIFF